MDAQSQPHVVIVGAGFGGLACATELGGSQVRVTIIDRNNYHLFVPLLYQVATAALSPADIAQPIRRLMRRHRNVGIVLDEVTGVDTQARQVLTRDGARIGYDRLVLAPGSSYSYFGHPEWAAIAPGPRTLDDALQIRSRLLRAFERAEASEDPAEQDALLTVVVVGGGPTGVEIAGAVAELARLSLAQDFRRIDPTRARIVLVEAGPRLLPPFPERLAAHAQAALERLGVTVWTGNPVVALDENGVTVKDRGTIRAANVIWGAGIKPSPAGEWIGVTGDKAGRVPVEADLSVMGLEGVYAIGDTALCRDADGKPLPGLAQVAKQQGSHLGRALRESLEHGRPMPPFAFHDRGNTAVIGRNAGVFDWGRHQLKGRPAWLLWAIVHIYLLTGLEKRMLVAMQWLWRYLTYERGARLIYGGAKPAGRRDADAPPDGA